MFILLLVAISTVSGGTLLTYLFDDDVSFPAHVCTGVAAGFVAFAFAGLIFASLLPFSCALLGAAVVCVSPAALLTRRGFRTTVHENITKTMRELRHAVSNPSRAAASYLVFYVLAFVFLCLTFERAAFVKTDGLYTGFSNNLGDLPFHLSIITSFAQSQNFPPDDPTFTGSRFAYPFLVDLIAAMFVRTGASLIAAQFLENILLGFALVGLVHRWTLAMTRDRLAGVIAPVLVFFSGGLGWLVFLKEAARNPHGAWKALLWRPHDYTIIPATSWRWGNAVTSLLVPQRSMLFGLSVAVVIFTQWWLTVVHEPSEKSDSLALPTHQRMVAAGVLAGMLPLIHTHTWMVVMAMAGCLALLFRNWCAWTTFFAVALLLSAPQAWWMLHGSAVKVSAFYAWHFGWERGEENAAWFWLRNTGVFIPALVAAVLWRGKQYVVTPRLLRFYAPFLLCFLIPNAITFAPWIWDNIKVLFYWYLASVPLVAVLLAQFFRSGPFWRIAGGLLLLSLTFAGSLDIWRVISRTTEFRLFDREGMAFANQVLQHTEPRALVLHAPVFDTPLFLAGRRSLLGYPGWAWSRGLDFRFREAAIREIYAGSPQAPALMREYGVDYVVFGPMERAYMPVSDEFFSRYSKIAETREYQLYRVDKR
jgi:hypothetical protein